MLNYVFILVIINYDKGVREYGKNNYIKPT